MSSSPSPKAVLVHELDSSEQDAERYAKRPKLENQPDAHPEHRHILPPSHALLGIPLPEIKDDTPTTFLETDVGISEYVSRGIAKIDAIIKQRFTDFLVYEIDQENNVVHLKNIDKPDSHNKHPTPATVDEDDGLQQEKVALEHISEKAEPAVPSHPTSGESWPQHFTDRLSKYLSPAALEQLRKMYLEGPEPPRVSDSGWGGRVSKAGETASLVEEPTVVAEPEQPSPVVADNSSGRQAHNRGRKGGRRGRGNEKREDTRRVLSEPMDSKDTRTELHRAIRELFGGKLDSETDMTSGSSDDGSRVAITWAKRGGRSGRSANTGRGNFPPYIHFTLQKTNRDTQDALGHLARTLRISVKDLSVAGTKDKRGVTVQRVSLKRNGKTVEDIWKLANGLNGKRTHKDIITQRGERGIRLADFVYRRASLELGMLKGNAFVITLRNVKVDSVETLNAAMNSIKHKGFINYYGMQRFGTASVPTHAIGLALLKSDWHKAVSLILQKRPGEHPDVEAARDAWLGEGNLDKALELMPRRVVAERCILESYKKQKGDTRNAMGALSTIPRNLRLMYVHAYQSYVWNAIVSERIRRHGAERPVVGDLVFEARRTAQDMDLDVDIEDTQDDDDNDDDEAHPKSHKRSRKPWSPPRIKTLTGEDLDKYTIFDVLMPLPGTDVAYPGGELGARYREFLVMDGLDPDNFVRKQKEYTLHGSYRAIMHLPKSLEWSVLRYTDPDVALAQADEDKLLGFDPPKTSEDGKFMALQIEISLGTASYATMALREITKAETSSQYQTSLTQAAEDQQFRGYEDGKEA
ncbi:hypothetical protein AX16_001049 [Volvariella volvacea WC 439]|nr:hypothetical protein AX16_001049 [Volvariella volvacea WC 439]